MPASCCVLRPAGATALPALVATDTAAVFCISTAAVVRLPAESDQLTEVDKVIQLPNANPIISSTNHTARASPPHHHPYHSTQKKKKGGKQKRVCWKSSVFAPSSSFVTSIHYRTSSAHVLIYRPSSSPQHPQHSFHPLPVVFETGTCLRTGASASSW